MNVLASLMMRKTEVIVSQMRGTKEGNAQPKSGDFVSRPQGQIYEIVIARGGGRVKMRARDRRTRKGPERVAKGRSGRPATKRGRRSDPDFRTSEAKRKSNVGRGGDKKPICGLEGIESDNRSFGIWVPSGRCIVPCKGGAGDGDKDDQGYSRSEIEGDSIEFFHLT